MVVKSTLLIKDC